MGQKNKLFKVWDEQLEEFWWNEMVFKSLEQIHYHLIDFHRIDHDGVVNLTLTELCELFSLEILEAQNEI